MDNLTACNPLAHRVRVYYEGTDTIYQGMLVCYNHDTTTNWFGGSVANTGEVTASSTTAEGSQNVGKYVRVEKPSTSNKRFPAGVVCPGGWVGKAGPRAVDIYVPNGAIVPVYTDRSVTINDKAYLEPSAYTIPNDNVADGVCIGYFMETIDRSSTAGLALCKLQQPDLESIASATTLGVGLSPLLWGDAPLAETAMNPSAGINYFNDFMDEVDITDDDGWSLTQSNSTGTVHVEAVAAGGVLEIDSAGSAADDSINAQLENCAVKPAAGANIWFEARVKVEDATQQYFIGLAAVDTTLMASGALDDVSDKAGFFHAVASTDNKISSVTARTSADDATTDVASVVDDTWMTIGFRITGLTQIEFYVNGVLVETGSTAANIPNAGMCLSVFSGYESAGNIVSIDWVKIVTEGGRDA